MKNKKIQLSHKLSYILRHNPYSVGLSLNEYGYVKTDDLIETLKKEYGGFDFNYLKEIVDTDKKHRFSFSEDYSLIRANYGHSIKCDLSLPSIIPPDVLYHGTAKKYVDEILLFGLNRQQRNYVHLSTNIETAREVGSRHGEVVILKVDAKKLKQDGFNFYKATDNIYLTGDVPVDYIEILGDKHTHCTMCGKKLDIWDKHEKFYFDKYIGYGSKHDLKHIRFDLCCDCFDKVMDKILPMFDEKPIEEYEENYVGEFTKEKSKNKGEIK